MTKLQIGEQLTLPLEVVTEKLAFLGRTGSGKTYAAMKLAELMLEAGAQIGAIDPVGVWRALRVPAEKGGRSFDVVVFGGLYGDLPLEGTEHAGTVVADLFCDRGLSFVLDISQFIPAEQQRVVRAFAERFFHRRKSAPAAVHLFMEECQEYIPENPSGQEALTLSAMQRLWKLGRNFGIGGSLISQRPQEISKKALNMSGTLFAFQMTGPQERKAIKSWVADHGVATDIEAVLQKLKIGEPHVESPTFLNTSSTIRILPRITADLSSTPKVGANQVARRPLTPIDVENLRSALKETIERAKADDPKELKKQLAELRTKNSQLLKQLEHTKASTTKSEVKGQRLEAALTEADRELLKALREDFTTFSEDISAKADTMLTSLADRAKASIDDALKTWTDQVDRRRELFAKRLEGARVQRLLEKLDRVEVRHVAAPHTPARPPVRRPAAAPVAPRTTQRGPAGAAGVHRVNGTADSSIGRSGLYRMMVALAQRPGLNRRQLGLRATVATSGGSFNTYLSKGRTNGWIVENGGGGYQLTDAGYTALGSYEPLPEGAELAQHYLRELGTSGAARMLSALLNAYPNGLTRTELSDAAQVDAGGGSFNTYLSKLRTLELVTGKQTLTASEELFN